MQNDNIQDVFTEAKQNLIRIFPYVIIIFLLILTFSQCEAHLRTANRYEQNEKIKNDSIRYFKNKVGTLTASVGTAQLTLEEFKAQKSKELQKITNEFNKLQNVIQYKAVGTIDTIFVPFEKPIVCDETKTDSTTFLRNGTVEKDWLTFNYDLNNSGFTIDSVKASIDVVSVTGFKKKWFLGRSMATTDVTSTTPNVVITDLKSDAITIPKKFYETNLFLIAAGFFIRSITPIR